MPPCLEVLQLFTMHVVCSTHMIKMISYVCALCHEDIQRIWSKAPCILYLSNYQKRIQSEEKN